MSRCPASSRRATRSAWSLVLVLSGCGAVAHRRHDDGAVDAGAGVVDAGPPPDGVARAKRPDLDGDGIADLVVGAPGVAVQTGAVYAFLGGADGLDLEPAARVLGPYGPEGRFGAALAVLGDVDGDGRSEIAAHEAGMNRLYVLRGAEGGLDPEPLAAIPASGLWVPASMAGGDFDGDGAGDLVVSREDGQAVVYRGEAALASGLVSETLGAELGAMWQVAPAGDVNADGCDDLIRFRRGVGARVDLYLGSRTGLADPPFASVPLDDYGWLWSWAVGAGDLDGDGSADLATGALSRDLVPDVAVRFAVGAAPGAGWETPLGGTPGVGEWLRYPAVGDGDANGDGFGDLVLRVTGARLLVFAGGAPFSAEPIRTLASSWEDEASKPIAFVGDLEGDGYDDLAVGSPAAHSVAIHRGSEDGPEETPSYELFGAEGDGTFHGGPRAASTGDNDGDGLGDVLVGVPEENRAYWYRGPLTAAPWDTQILEAPDGGGTSFGRSAASAGDVNGDGYGDAIVGAPGVAAWGGRAYVYLGGPDGLATEPAVVLEPELRGAFGGAVAGLGDVDADGYDDVAVAASDSFQVYFFRGGPDGTEEVGTILESPDADDDHFGISVAGAGDVNDDGYADLIVGTDRYVVDESSGVEVDIGRAYVFAGGPSGFDALPTTTLVAPPDTGTFGRSVTGLGDFDGDGFEDAAVGSGGSHGLLVHAHLYRGGPDGLYAVPDGTVTFGAQGSAFVRGVGDLDGDGLGDLALSTDSPDDWGPAAVYLGRAKRLSGEEDVMVEGVCATGAGDFDGDGLADVVLSSAHTIRAFRGPLAPDVLSPDAFLMPPDPTGGGFGAAVVGVGDD